MINSTIDKNLIIPGKSAEGYIIGEMIDYSEDLVCFKQEKSIGEIVEIDSLKYLQFDCLFYIKNTSVLFLKNSRIIAIAGLNTERRITSDGVVLSRGIDNFILNYGNSGLLTITKGNHRAYHFKDSGIILFNDFGDSSIDMYLIFKNKTLPPLSK